MSIVGPVKRILAAIRRIATGETHVRVPRGGIRELDVLAAALNTMAEQLSVAQSVTRNYQAELEARVEERTRQLLYLAEHDPLTQLPNRRQLFTLLNAALGAPTTTDTTSASSSWTSTTSRISTTAWATRSAISCCRQSHSACARSRIASASPRGSAATNSPSVFAGASDTDDIHNAGLELVRAFQQPLPVDGRDIMVGVSVGVSIYPRS